MIMVILKSGILINTGDERITYSKDSHFFQQDFL